MASFEQAEEVLKRCFGHDGFRPEQEKAIKAIMGKRDVLAVMSTGAGKSLIYQVPAVALVAAPGEALRLDEPWQRELAADLEWNYRPPYVVVDQEGGE